MEIHDLILPSTFPKTQYSLFEVMKRLKQKHRRESLKNEIIGLKTTVVVDGDNIAMTSVNYNPQNKKKLAEMFYELDSSDKEEVVNSMDKILHFFSVSEEALKQPPSCQQLSPVSENEYKWLKQLIHKTENVPVCVVVYSTKQKNRFSIVYTNKHFSKLTEFKRCEIIGEDYDVLSPYKSSSSSSSPSPSSELKQDTDLLHISMKLGFATAVIIQSVKRSGVLFYNFILLKPVFDTEGHYLYCVGIHTETMDNKSHIENKDKDNIQRIIDSIDFFI